MRTWKQASAAWRMVKLKKAGANLVDCAVAGVRDGIKADGKSLRGLGMLAGVGPDFLDEGEQVAKVGRTTGLTRGRVTAFELDNLVVAFALGNLRFDNQAAARFGPRPPGPRPPAAHP